MIITRTPFRITLGGGGTDLPSYYQQHGGFIFAAALNKYMFINLNRPIVDDCVRVKYSKTEIVDHRDELQHDIAREALRMMDIETAIEIISMADVPAGTGLGSSSSYAVGLLNALRAMKREYIPLQDLAEQACDLELGRLGKPIGKQDQYMAAFGGLTVLDIARDGKVAVREANIDHGTLDDLSRNLLMFYTQTTRSADQILSEQSSGAKAGKQHVVDSMHQIKEIGYRILEAVESGNLSDVGLLFHQHWEHKKRISTRMSNPRFNEIYDTALAAGALGGKISGAGGGGFFVFYVEGKHREFSALMHKKFGLREMRHQFDLEGTKVLVNFTSGRGT